MFCTKEELEEKMENTILFLFLLYAAITVAYLILSQKKSSSNQEENIVPPPPRIIVSTADGIRTFGASNRASSIESQLQDIEEHYKRTLLAIRVDMAKKYRVTIHAIEEHAVRLEFARLKLKEELRDLGHTVPEEYDFLLEKKERWLEWHDARLAIAKKRKILPKDISEEEIVNKIEGRAVVVSISSFKKTG